MTPIEPGILPLVESLNQTGLVQTFSSCEGHFGAEEQTIVDQNHAYVRFVPAEGITPEQVETALGKWLIAYKKKHGLMPCCGSLQIFLRHLIIKYEFAR